MKRIAFRLNSVHYAYRLDGHDVPALRGIDLVIREGEMVAIQGPSGSGKSTLLYLLGCMLKPDSGSIRILGQDVERLSDTEKAYFRNRHLGFVFQQFHLLPSRDVLGNIMLPAAYPLEAPGADGNLITRAKQLAERLGLESRLDHKPHQLSGGQQQRVAIARALIRDAPIILADEPTGNLDSKSSQEIMTLLKELNADGKTVVIITHDREVAEQCQRTIWIRDGRVIEKPSDIKDEANDETSIDFQYPRLTHLGLVTLVRESLPQALDNLFRNRARTFLTMMGVVVGVASVLSMLTLGKFTKDKILQSYAMLGVNTLVFNATPNWRLKAKDIKGQVFYALDVERDLNPLRKIFPEIQRIAPSFTSTSHTAIYAGRSIENEILISGVNEHSFAITRRQMAFGSPIQKFHIENNSSVCVIGFEIAERLFQRQNPIGEPLQVAIDENTFSCKVIGVAAPTYTKERRFRPDLEVTLPYTYFMVLPFHHWTRRLREIHVEVNPSVDVAETGRKLQAYFEKRYGNTGRFGASSNTVLIAQMNRFLNLFTVLLGCIAAVTLIVGGMGITNMMLVSVNERLREIGLRKAVGASHTAIRQLFFAESLFLCFTAGLIGLIGGFIVYHGLIYAGSRFIENLRFEWVFDPLAFGFAFVAIVVTGILSGLGPAVKAEKLQVIEALRAE